MRHDHLPLCRVGRFSGLGRLLDRSFVSDLTALSSRSAFHISTATSTIDGVNANIIPNKTDRMSI